MYAFMRTCVYMLVCGTYVYEVNEIKVTYKEELLLEAWGKY